MIVDVIGYVPDGFLRIPVAEARAVPRGVLYVAYTACTHRGRLRRTNMLAQTASGGTVSGGNIPRRCNACVGAHEMFRVYTDECRSNNIYDIVF